MRTWLGQWFAGRAMAGGLMRAALAASVLALPVQAQVPPDDLTTMTAEQRRAYLEEYLKRLSGQEQVETGQDAPAASPAPSPVTAPAQPVVTPPPPPVKTAPAPKPVVVREPLAEQPLTCTSAVAPAAVSPYQRLVDDGGLPQGSQWVLRSQPAADGRFGALMKDGDSLVLEQRCVQQPAMSVRYARVSYSSGQWALEFDNGLVAEGGVLVPTSQGYLLDQKGVLMDFRLGQPVRMVRLPERFRLAEMQHTDVAQSRVVLLLSTQLLKPRLSLKALGQMLGLRGKTEEVNPADADLPAVLFNLDTGKAWAVELDADELAKGLKARCKHKEWSESRGCGALSDREWALDGAVGRLSDFYFWRLGWVGSPRGFDLWVFNPEQRELVLSNQNGANFRRQVVPAGIKGVWWRNEGAKPSLVLDSK